MSESLVIDQPEQAAGRDWRRAIPAVVMAGILGFSAAACSEDHEASPAAATSSPSPEVTTLADACGETNTSANSADTEYGSPESVFPATAIPDKKTGHSVPFTAEKASETLIHQVTHDVRVLGVTSEIFIETRSRQQLPDTGTLGRAERLIQSYQTNAQAQFDALTKVCATFQAPFLKHTDSFAVTRGQATEIDFNRNDQVDKVTSISTDTMNATENLSGWQVDYNHDDPKLTDTEKAIYDKLRNLMLITDDGRIVINQTFGPNSFELSKAKVQTPVTIKIGADKQITIKKGTSEIKLPVSTEQNEDNGSDNNNGGSQTSGHTGGKEAPQKGPVPEKQSGPQTGPSTGGTTGTKEGDNTSPQGGGGVTPTPSPSATGPGPGPAGPGPGPGSGGSSPSPSPAETTPSTPTSPQPSTAPPSPRPSTPPPSPKPSPSPTPKQSTPPASPPSSPPASPNKSPAQSENPN